MVEQFVLVHKDTGDEYVFTSRAEYLNTKASGGYKDKHPQGEAPTQQPQRRQPERSRPEENRPQPAAPKPVEQQGPQPKPEDKPVAPEPPHA